MIFLKKITNNKNVNIIDLLNLKVLMSKDGKDKKDILTKIKISTK